MGSSDPLRTAVESHGYILALVVGPRGSVSKDFDKLLSTMADIGAERSWHKMGARTVLDARTTIKGRLRRSIGITAVVAEAMLRSDRLGIALGDGEAAARRRREAKTKFWSWRDEMSRRGAPYAGYGWKRYSE